MGIVYTSREEEKISRFQDSLWGEKYWHFKATKRPDSRVWFVGHTEEGDRGGGRVARG